MNKYINLIIGIVIYFVPAMVMYCFLRNTDWGIMIMIMWLSFAWALSLWVINYLEN